MNIEIANRLVELRKKSGLSQEDLAAKLGLSRQAVSKWERAEASPDTDNLICLAKLYGVSLDQLLSTDEDIDTIAKEQREKEAEKKEESKSDKDDDGSCDFHGTATFTDDGDEIHIGKDGIHVKDKNGEEVHVSSKGINIVGKDGDHTKSYDWDDAHIKYHGHSVFSVVSEILSGVAALGVLVAYICLGLLVPNGWAMWWVLIFLVPVVSSLGEAIHKKRFCKFAYPCVVLFVYLFLGMAGTTGFIANFNGWHPYWFLFLTIPVFYAIFKPIDMAIMEAHYRRVHHIDKDTAIDVKVWKEFDKEAYDDDDEDED